MKRLIFILAAIFLFPSCILNVLDTSDRLDRRGTVTLDTPKNRKFFLAAYERGLAQERQRISPPPAYRNWDESWERIFQSLRSGHQENPEFYINYIKQRRKELGLPRR